MFFFFFLFLGGWFSAIPINIFGKYWNSDFIGFTTFKDLDILFLPIGKTVNDYMMNTFDCGFIMTEEGEGLVDTGNKKIVDKMILAFNRDGLLHREDLFSLPPQVSYTYTAFQIIVNIYSFGTLPYDLFDTLYNNAWEYDFVFLSKVGSSFFFSQYMAGLSPAILQVLNL